MPGYKLQPAAERDLEEIWLYTVEQWGIKQADKYIDDIDRTFQLLADQPLICCERMEFTPPVRIHQHAHHLIVYIELKKDINVIRVLHKSMDVEGQLDDEVN